MRFVSVNCFLISSSLPKFILPNAKQTSTLLSSNGKSSIVQLISASGVVKSIPVKLLIKWKRGDCITWPWRDVPHGTCNYGHKPRPVLNITGIVTEGTKEFLSNATT